jgi:hypothetical protein
MATRKSTRSTPGRARSSGPCPPASRPAGRRQVKDLETAGCPPVPPESLRQLTVMTLRLRAIYGTAVAAELALRAQAAEQDAEIADCLRAGVCDPIAEQLRDLEDVVHRLRSEAPEAYP